MTIDVLEGLRIEKEVKLSEFVERVEYVKLESTPNSFIKYPDFQITANYIIASSQYPPAKVLLFKRNGEFVRKIGSYGRGPGEYQRVQAIARNEDYILLHDYSLGKLLTYDYSGSFIKSIDYLNVLETKILQILPLDNNGYAICLKRPIKKMADFPLIKIMTQDLEFAVDKLLVENSVRGSPGIIQPTFYLKNEKIHLREFYYDTLYVEKGDQMIPKCLFLIRSKPIPGSVFYESSQMNYSGYNRIAGHAEIDQYLCINVQQSGDIFFAGETVIYDNNTQEIFRLAKLTTFEPDSVMNEDDGFHRLIKNPRPLNLPAFYNDIDGFYHWSVASHPIDDNHTNGMIFRKLDVADLKYYIENEYHIRQHITNPESREELMKLVQNSTEYDNPILQIFHLKK